MLVTNECSSWFNGVDNFLLPVWDRRNEILHAEGSACKVSQTNHTPECEVNGTER